VNLRFSKNRRKYGLVEKSDAQARGNIKILDPVSIILLMVVIAIVYLMCVTASLRDGFVQKLPFSILLMVLTFRLTAIWSGIELNLESGKLSFPGGGLAANSVIDYINPKFLAQYFKRITVDLDDVISIGSEQRWVFTMESFFLGFGAGKSDKNKQRRIIGIITINGGFGAASIKFKSLAKRDQAYSSISYYLSMGRR